MKKLILLFIVAGMMTFAVQGEARGVAYDKKGRPVSYSRHYKRGSRGNVFFYKLSRNWQYLYDGSVATGRIMKVNTVCLRNNRLYFTYERTVRTEKGVRSTVDSRKFYRRDGRALRREEITSYCYDPASGLRTRSRDVIIYKLDGSRLQNSFYLSWDKNAYITRREKLVYDASGRKSRVSSRTVTREAGSVSVRVSDSDYEYFKDGAAEKTLITREEMFKCRGKLVYVLEEKIEKSGQEEKIVTEKINYENGVMVSRENIVEEPVPGGVNVIRRVVYDFKENKEYSYVNNDLVREIFYDGTGNVLEKKEYEYTSAELSAVYYYNGDGKLLKKEQSTARFIPIMRDHKSLSLKAICLNILILKERLLIYIIWTRE
jgi:hypothetical protein